MNSTWPDRNAAVIDRHVTALRLAPVTASQHRRILAEFQELAWRHAPHGLDEQAARTVVQEWARRIGQRWSPSTLAQRIGIVSRFLDTLVAEGRLSANPIVAWRTQYRMVGNAKVARALTSPDPLRAFEALGRKQCFASFIGPLLQEHVQLMRTLGYRYRTQERRLLCLDAFLQGRPDLVNASPVIMLQEWLAVHPTAKRARQCQAMQADLAKAWRRTDAELSWPRPDPRLIGRVTRRRPRILTADEVQRLLNAALAMPSPRTPLRPLALCAMLQIAYCMGMRRSEITRLTLGDVDLTAGTITVRDSKFFKSRVLPMSTTLIDALNRYVDTRARVDAPQSASSAFFWHAKPSGRYCVENAGGLLSKVFRRAGLKPAQGDGGARLHDVRHTYAVTRLVQWYHDGVDVQARLPVLAAFMGHADIQFTTTYLSMTPELMQAASERFAAHSAQLRQAMAEVTR